MAYLFGGGISVMKNKNDKPFSHPRWNQIPAVRIVGDSEVTEEETKKVEEYKKQYFTKQEKLKEKLKH